MSENSLNCLLFSQQISTNVKQDKWEIHQFFAALISVKGQITQKKFYTKIYVTHFGLWPKP